MTKYNKIDLHLHTTASDGSDTASELLKLACEAGLEVISITDHDTILGLTEAMKITNNKVKLITGIEFSCHFSGETDFDCHILGYGFDPSSEHISRAIEHGRQMRLAKLNLRIEYLKEKWGIVFNDEEIAWLYSLNSAARPHLARLIIDRGLADSVADAIDKYLKGDGFPDDRIDALEAIEAIRLSGGVSVYAHPIGGERERRLGMDEVLPRIVALKSIGLMGLECYYSRYSKEEERMLLSIAEAHGLLTSAGSDYHGRNKTVPFGALCSDGGSDDVHPSVLDAAMKI